MKAPIPFIAERGLQWGFECLMTLKILKIGLPLSRESIRILLERQGVYVSRSRILAILLLLQRFGCVKRVGKEYKITEKGKKLYGDGIKYFESLLQRLKE